MEKENESFGPSKHPVQIKGTSWMLEDCRNNNSPMGTAKNISRVLGQSHKWKKNINNRFQGYSRTIENTIKNRFKNETKNFNPFAFESLRHTESQSTLSTHRGRLSHTFHDSRVKLHEGVFNLERKEKSIQNKIGKMSRLKQMTDIFERKKMFYDNCVEHYFVTEEKEINKTISKIAHRSNRSSKATHKYC